MLLTVDEVSLLLRVSATSVRRMARDGRIPGAKHVGREWRFDERKLHRWLAEPE